MAYSIRKRWILQFAGVLFLGFIATACTPKDTRYDYLDKTGNHESPHPHTPEIGKSTPESDEEIVRVRNEKERARMERYIAEFVRPEDIVTTIEIAGETVDCVAIDRQPALRRADMRNHVPQLRPPSSPKEEPKETPTTIVGDPVRREAVLKVKQVYGAKTPICPEKSVPIRRLTIEILDNFETLEDFFRARPPHDLTGPTDKHQYAYSYVTGDNTGGRSPRSTSGAPIPSSPANSACRR